MNSFLDSETLRKRGRRGRPRTGFPVQSSKFKVRQKLGSNLALRDGQGRPRHSGRESANGPMEKMLHHGNIQVRPYTAEY
jgi:hypothetical protein